MVAAGAGADGRVVGAARVGVDGHVASRHVRDHGGDQERADALDAVLDRLGHVADHGVDAADAGADDAAGSPGERVVLDRVRQTGVAHRLGHGRPGVVHVAVVAADLLLRHERIGVEALDLAGHLGRGLDRVEQRDAVDAAAPVDERVPQCRDVVADRGDGAHAGHDHAVFAVTHRRCLLPSPGRAG